MKHLIFAAALSALACRSKMHAFLSLKDSGLQVTAMRDSVSIAGKWKLMPVLASDTAAGKIPEIDFDLKTNRISGNSGCNAMSGNFIIKNDALHFSENIISTKMACPGYNEKPFFDNLLKTNRYQIKDGVLQLMFNTTVLSQWTRHTDSTITKQI